MIIVDDDKKRPLPELPTEGYSSSSGPSTSAASTAGDSTVASSNWADPPPYTPSDPASSTIMSGTTTTTNSEAGYPDPEEPLVVPHDPTVDILSGDPIPYSSGPSVPPQEEIPDLPHQNRLRIHRAYQPISETLVIDPSLPSPPGTAQKNLELSSTSAPVLARVYVLDCRDLKGRVEMSAQSESGPVKLAVARMPRNAKLAVDVGTKSGPCELFLPLHFSGPLTIHTRTGPVSLGTSLRSRLRILEESSDVRKYWVGDCSDLAEDWRTFERGEWMGDEAEVRTLSGPARVLYWEGIGKVETFVTGLMKKLFG
ncbi:hypothetical protein DACRYDRAFT_19433 [Dacryopinax primogenitus]|uniref:DUF7330 domain-containing protein n=1 Tax=Dacryopinax primogenitus (strain DJM 731) TaxID=1858805 RepID=M5GFC5_DACPD|nr:uncharacterized protein DACRYDRAFT_19433 [Dacryopinax primogenitus]EJU06147.1 hypothetical protein DACRYDRAFT_19433 [Dacryopinax primogenitus]